MESQLHPCYTKPYKPLTIIGCPIDLRKEFVGQNYNYIKLPKNSEEGLSEKEKNYADVFFKAAIFTAEKGKRLNDDKIIESSKELFYKALRHGWSENELDEYVRSIFEEHKEMFKNVILSFSDKYLL
jgi:hypothetical protein